MGLELNRGTRRHGSHRRSDRGMSLVEVVIASFIMLILALGVLPLFTRSMASNASGADSTYVANMATERAEEFLQLAYDSPQLVIPLGQPERVFQEVYTESAGDFVPGTAETARTAGESPLWTRVTTVRQYNVNDLATPIPGEDPLNPNPSAQVKEIEVAVAGLREGGPLGASRALTVRVLKSP